MVKLINKIKERGGEGYVGTVISILAGIMVIALAVNFYPVFIVKDQLNTLAKQTLREAQIEGKIEIDYSKIVEAVGVEPDSVKWEAETMGNRKVQFGQDILVTFEKEVDIGFFEFGSFPINLKAKGKGKSEVYWK